MKRRGRVSAKQLEQLESEFSSLLTASLRERTDPNHDWPAEPATGRLQELAGEIQAIRAKAGNRNEHCDHFLNLCILRESKVQGESRLATALWADLRTP